MFNSDNNFSNPSPLFLESTCSLGEPSAESSLRLLLKKLLGFFLQVKHYQVYYLERSKAFLQWLQDVSMWWFLLWVINRNCLGIFHKIKKWWKIQIMAISKPGTVSAPRQGPGRGFKVSAVVVGTKCSIFKAAAFIPWPLALVQAPWNPWQGSSWFWWDLALAQLFSEQVSGFRPLNHKHSSKPDKIFLLCTGLQVLLLRLIMSLFPLFLNALY